MIADADLTRQNDVIAGRNRTGDADLAAQDVVPADLTVMTDLDEIIDLRPRPNVGGAEGGPVNGGACADFHVVVDIDLADLRRLSRVGRP